jgi:hypothetical protein
MNEDMRNPLSIHRPTLAVVPLVTGSLALACSSPEYSSWGELPEGHHVYDLAGVLRPGDEPKCPGSNPGVNIRLNLDIDVKDGGAEGWCALTGMNLGGFISPLFTVSSASVVGTKGREDRTSCDGFQFPVGTNTLAFSVFILRPGSNGRISGMAAGTYIGTPSFLDCISTFTAVLGGVPDVTPPGAKLANLEFQMHMPFEPIQLTVDEPVSLTKTTFEVRAGDAAVPVELVHGPVSRSGFADELDIAPLTSFPAGAPLSIVLHALTDAAGNSHDVELGPIDIAPEENTIDNLGFEQDLAGWLVDPPGNPEFSMPPGASTKPSLTMTAGNGALVDVKPAEGGLFATIKSGRLVGHLVPPAGKTKLRLSAAVVHGPASEIESIDTGLKIEIFAEGAPVVEADGKSLLLLADPMAGWTGWGTITIDLPKEASSGFWIQVKPRFPGAFPDFALLLDSFAFE